VYVIGSTATFKKEDPGDGDSGIIYGSNGGDGLKNTATGGNGHAVYVVDGPKIRNDTAGKTDTLDSTIGGSSGGWLD
jgi:hypothetical protein